MIHKCCFNQVMICLLAQAIRCNLRVPLGTTVHSYHFRNSKNLRGYLLGAQDKSKNSLGRTKLITTKIIITAMCTSDTNDSGNQHSRSFAILKYNS